MNLTKNLQQVTSIHVGLVVALLLIAITLLASMPWIGAEMVNLHIVWTAVLAAVCLILTVAFAIARTMKWPIVLFGVLTANFVLYLLWYAVPLM